jgi:hypothetical protein
MPRGGAPGGGGLEVKSSGRKRRARQKRMARKAQKATNARKAALKVGREPGVQRGGLGAGEARTVGSGDAP